MFVRRPSRCMVFIARADLNDEPAYQMVKALIDHYADLKTINPVMAEWKPEVAVRPLPIPYHPGAIKDYKEEGPLERPDGSAPAKTAGQMRMPIDWKKSA